MAIYKVEAPDGKILDIEGPEGADPGEILAYAESVYQAPAPKPVAQPTAAEEGDFMRGLKGYVPSIKETFGGAQVLAGRAFGSEDMMRSGMERVQKAQAEQKSKETDDLTVAWDKGIGSVLTDWLPYQIGSGVGNIAESVAMAGAGALLGASAGGVGAAPGAAAGFFGKQMVKKGIKEAAKDVIEKELAKGATKAEAREAGAAFVADMTKNEIEEQALKSLGRAGGRAYGATAGIGAQALLHGAGETTSRALQEAGMDPMQMDLGTLLPAAGVHAIADFLSEKILLGGLRGMDLGGLSQKSTGKLMYDIVKGASVTGLKEIPPETLQSVAERYGAKLPLSSAEAMSEYINTAGAAFAMSVLPGGIGGVRTNMRGAVQAAPEAAPTAEPTAELPAPTEVAPEAGITPVEEGGLGEMERERERQMGIPQPEEIAPVEPPTAPPVAEAPPVEPTVAPVEPATPAEPVEQPPVQPSEPLAPEPVEAQAPQGFEFDPSPFVEKHSIDGTPAMTPGLANDIGQYVQQQINDGNTVVATDPTGSPVRLEGFENGLLIGENGMKLSPFWFTNTDGQGAKLQIIPPQAAVSEEAKPTKEVAPEEMMAPVEEGRHPLEATAREPREQARAAAKSAGIDVSYRGPMLIDPANTTIDWGKLEKQKTAGAILSNMQDHVPLDYKAIIDRIMPAVKDIPVSINKRVTKGWGGLHSATITTGDQKIQYARKVHYGNTIETVLHEIIHGATVVNYLRGKRGIDPKYKKAAQELDDLAKQVRALAPARALPFMHSRSYTQAQWGMELIARAMTEREVQQVLKDIKLPDQKSAWTKFTELVAKLLGVPKGEVNAMTRLLEISEQFMEPVEVQKGKPKPTVMPKTETEPDTVYMQSVSPHRSYSGGAAPEPTWGLRPYADMSARSRIMDDLVYKYLDKHKDMKDVINAIKAAGRKVSATWDAYMKETLYHNRVAYLAKQFMNNELKPLAEAMVKSGITETQLNNYLLARHAEEYNKEINLRNDNPAVQDRGSGVHTLVARAYLGQLNQAEIAELRSIPGLNENEKKLLDDLKTMTPERMRNMQALAKRVDSIIRRTQDMSVAGGIEKQNTIDYWRDKYPNYVPLKRDPDELDFVASNLGMGAGFSTRAGMGKAAVGSLKGIDNILSNITLQRDMSIMRSEKARIGRALYGLFLQNPNPDFAITVNPNVTVVRKANELYAKIMQEEQKGHMPGSPEYDKLQQDKARYQRLASEAAAAQKKMIEELVNSGMVPEGVDPVQFAENMITEPEGAFYNKTTGKVEYRTNSFLRSAPNVLAIPIDGETRYIFFNPADERAMRMVKSLKNLDVEKLGEITSTVAKYTRWIAMVNTQYNPFFGILNMMRDVQGAQFNLSTTALKGQHMAVNAHIMPSMFAIYKSMRNERIGNDTEGYYADKWKEFQRYGGPTGYKDMLTRERGQNSSLQEEIDKLQETPTKKSARKAFDAIVGRLADFNDGMENAVRLSAFIEAQKKFAAQGLTAEQANEKAAELAKNLTVNFNRKGQKSQLVNSWYAFFNASAQGSARLIETMRGPRGKQLMAAMVLLGVMQSLLLKAAGFDEEDPPAFVREKNIVIPTGNGKYVSWPMPLGFNVFVNFGRIATDGTTDILFNGGRNIAKNVANMASVVSNTFNPFGSSGLSIQTIAPTIVDPLAALSENKDAFGRPIYREDRATNPTPGYLRSRDGTFGISKFLSEAMNRMSGGTEFQKGYISPTADEIEYLAGQLGGGVWREGRKLFGLASDVAAGEETAPYRIPLVGRFYGDTGAKANISNRFYENVTQLAKYEQEIMGRAKSGQDYQQFMQDVPEASLFQVANRLENTVSQLNKARKMLKEQNAPQSQIKQIDEYKIQLMNAFNEQFYQATKQ